MTRPELTDEEVIAEVKSRRKMIQFSFLFLLEGYGILLFLLHEGLNKNLFDWMGVALGIAFIGFLFYIDRCPKCGKSLDRYPTYCKRCKTPLIDLGDVDEPVEAPALTIDHKRVFDISMIKLRLISLVATLFFAILTYVGYRNGGVLIAMGFSIFSIAGLYLFLFFGNVKFSRSKIEQRTIMGRYGMRWEEITEMQYFSSFIVLKGTDKQLVIPQFSYWSGKNFADALEAFWDQIERLKIAPSKNLVADFTLSRNCRLH